MICISGTSQDPYFNIAAEEFLLKNFDQNILMLWRSKASIIVGKHQNTLAEINYPFVKKQNIDIVRRLSGGGTVYHDLGNINFTFIKSKKPDVSIDYEDFTKPVIEFLNSNGVKAKFGGRNDIIVDGKKISGNAEHVLKGRVLHHGTLLYDSEIDDLRNSLKITKGVYTDKAVQSVMSSVVNISDYIDNKFSAEVFMMNLFEYFLNIKDNWRYDFDKKDKSNINKLADEKYKTWEWTFSKSPNYSFRKNLNIGKQEFNVELKVEKGIIIYAKLVNSNNKLSKDLEKALLNCKHEEIEISNAINNISYKGFEEKEFVSQIF